MKQSYKFESKNLEEYLLKNQIHIDKSLSSMPELATSWPANA